MDRDLHKSLFWLYGVIVGLAIKEALTAAVPLFLVGLPLEEPFFSTTVATRLVVFLLIAVRFFLGSVVYYDHAYFGTDSDPVDHYRLDFLSGFFHFLLVFAWSLTLVPSEQVSQWAYRVLLALVLLYDLLWWWLCKGKQAKHKVRVWALVNLATALLACLTFLLCDQFSAVRGFSEIPALGWVALASVIDIAGMIRGKSFFHKWFNDLGGGGGLTPPPPETSTA